MLITKNGFSVAVCALAGIVIAAGCGKDQKKDKGAQDNGVSNAVGAAASGVATNTGPKTLAQMAPGDVIVSVNGVVLTKAQCDLGMKQIIQQLNLIKNPQRGQQMSMLRAAAQTYIPRYVSSQLMLQEARRLGVMKPDDLKARTEELIAGAAKSAGQKVEVFQKSFPGGPEALQKEVEQTVLISALIATNIPPKVKVDDAFVAATMVSIKEDNDVIAATNALKVARLNELRKEILGGADFGALADKYSECERSAPGNQGYWGEFERSEFSDRKMRAAVFALKPGDLSEVLEDDEGYHLVKVLEYVPPKKNAKGIVFQQEAAKLAHIQLTKEPMLELATKSNLRDDLTQQMQQQATAEYVKGLQSTAVILYPNGTNFWASATGPQAKPQPSAAPAAKAP